MFCFKLTTFNLSVEQRNKYTNLFRLALLSHLEQESQSIYLAGQYFFSNKIPRLSEGSCMQNLALPGDWPDHDALAGERLLSREADIKIIAGHTLEKPVLHA